MSKAKKRLFLFFFICLGQMVFAQTQIVRGVVKDKESQQNLAEAEILLATSLTDTLKTITNIMGEFTLQNIAVGRHTFEVRKAGYKTIVLSNIIVNSAKEVVLQIELEEDLASISNVSILAKSRTAQLNNENAVVSARQFTVDETDRFAGSRGDPARMASNFAGVQGADDSRNDIVVRGNSPQGVLWRLEGIDIPNPNHFAIPGTTGGPVSIINNKILANSDFFTGAFPAEYGNSTAGVFDLRLRNGNNKKREYSTQLGFLGWDLLAEGPFSKNSKASFLVTYRYSTLALFSALKIPIGTDAVPQYQDISFKLNFPLNKKVQLNFWGIGGTSKINILISNQKQSSTNLYGDNDRDQRFKSAVGVFGANYTYQISDKSNMKWSVAYSGQRVAANHSLVFRTIVDTIIQGNESFFKYRLDSLVPNLSYLFKINSTHSHLFFSTKLNKHISFKYGLIITHSRYNFNDSSRIFNFLDTQNYWKWSLKWNSEGKSTLVQPYIQAKYKINNNLVLNFGLMSQYFAIQDHQERKNYISISAIEPRIGMRYQLNKNQSLQYGAGLHAQLQPAYVHYYLLPGNAKPHNLKMGFTKSFHNVLGYEINLNKSTRLKSEIYYQYVFQIPVERKMSSFSLANTGSGFARFFPDTLENTGLGRNYGIEMSLEKSFTKGYYYLVSLSIFDAQYQGSDKKWRASDFNTGYAGNILFAKEWNINKTNALNVGGKFTFAGARRFSPMDTLASRAQREYVEVDALKNSQRFGKAYFRFDLRIAYRINGKRLTHEIALDLVNVTNRKNILKYSYLNEAPYFRQEFQLGFLPLFYYKLDF